MKMMTWYREGEVPPQIRCRRQSEPGSCPPSQPEVMVVMMVMVMVVMMVMVVVVMVEVTVVMVVVMVTEMSSLQYLT